MIGYATTQDLVDYAAARALTLTGDATIALTRALDWLELRRFQGQKSVAGQANEWPRSGVYIDGTLIADDTVPDRIKTAQLVAAMIYDGGGDPMGAIDPRVIAESVDGAVSVEYSDKGNQVRLYPQLNATLGPYLRAGGGMGVVRV